MCLSGVLPHPDPLASSGTSISASVPEMIAAHSCPLLWRISLFNPVLPSLRGCAHPTLPFYNPWPMTDCCYFVAKSCLPLCDPVYCSLPGSSAHGVSQARIPEWVAISFFRGTSWLRDRTRVGDQPGIKMIERLPQCEVRFMLQRSSRIWLEYLQLRVYSSLAPPPACPASLTPFSWRLFVD